MLDKKYKNIKCKFDLTRYNCTYWPEFKATCPSNCPNRRKDYKGNIVENDYISIIESQNQQMLEALIDVYKHAEESFEPQPLYINKVQLAIEYVTEKNINEILNKGEEE